MENTSFTLWPIVPFGGEDGSPADSGGGQPAGDDSAENSSGQGSQGDSGSGTQGGQGRESQMDSASDGAGDDEFEGYSAKELKRIASDLAKAKKTLESERDSYKQKVDADERKKRSDVENLARDLDAERQANKSLRAALAKQAILGAIRDDTRYQWHDPEMVAGLLDPEVVKVGDDGKVEGLKAQLTKIAKEHEFLLKKGAGSQQNGQGQSGSGPTGFQPGQGGASGSAGTNVEAKQLAENYPALASRMV